MPFTIPDYANATYPEQSGPDAVDFDALAAGFATAGVVSGCAVTPSALMVLAVSAGSAWFSAGTAAVAYAGGTVTIGTADATNPRIDLVTISNAGAAAVTAGTAAAHPVFPAIPANTALCAAVWVPATATTISSGSIIDKRLVGVRPVAAGGTGASTAAAALANLGATTFNRIGSFLFAGHSWLVFGGSGGDEQGRRAEGVAGRFASMENISTTEVISLGRSGASLTDDSSFPLIGWAGLQQLLNPPAMLRPGISGAYPSAPYTSQPGGLFLLYGINDTLRDFKGFAASSQRGVYRAFAHAVRATICARRSGGHWDERHVARTVADAVTNSTTTLVSATAAFVLTDQGKDVSGTGIPAGTKISTVNNATSVTLSKAATTTASGQSFTVGGKVAFSGFATTVTTAKASGVGYRKSVVNGDTFTFTLPDDFPGGTIGIQLIGSNDANSVLGAAVITAPVAGTSESWTLSSAQSIVGTVITGQLLIVDSEQVLVTAGGGTTTITVTRGANGTTPATHVINSLVLGVAGAQATWSGTCTGASGKVATPVSAQGCASSGNAGTIPIVTRFTGLTAADAGSTIIGTVAGIPATAGEQFVGFDKAFVEATTPGPIVVCDAPEYAYGGFWVYNTPAMTTGINGILTSVVAEFDATVTIASIAAEFLKYGAVLGTVMNATDTSTVVTLTPGSIGPSAGEYVRIGSEECFVTAVSGTSYTLRRGDNNTTKATHAISDAVYNRSLYSGDNVHPSSYGYRVLAGLLKTTFGAMSLTAQQLNEANGYYRVEPQTLRNNTYFTTRGDRGRLRLTDQKHTWMSIIVHRPIIVTGIACEVLTAGSAGALGRLVIAGDNGGGFIDQTIVDTGTVALTATGKQETTGIRQFLNPGVYWLGLGSQGAAATQPIMRSLINLVEGLQPPGIGDATGDVFGSGSLTAKGTSTIATTVATVIPHGLAVTPDPADVTWWFTAQSGFQSRFTVLCDATNITITPGTSVGTGPYAIAWKVDARDSATEFAKTGWTGTGVAGQFGSLITAATAGEAALLALRIETVEPV